MVMILKDKLKHIWHYRSRSWDNKAIDQWCLMARSIKQPSLTGFAKILDRHRYSIVKHCDYPMHTGKIEGVTTRSKLSSEKLMGSMIYATLH